jgi:predicted metal-binding membrane protein
MALLVALHRHDRAVVVLILLAAILGSWGYLLFGMEQPMPAMEGMAMPMPAPEWTGAYLALTLAMWMAMMAAMMLPSAVPMLLFYDGIAHRRRPGTTAIGTTSLFGLGYLSVWLGFSVGAVALQYVLEQASLLSPMMEATSIALAGGILVAAGIYQWTSLKQACLRHCRSPFDFVTTYWQGGNRGAFAMGLRHGIYCLGCCWVLMLLLFVGGVMNLAWIAAIALFVLVEKLAPAGHWLGKAAGASLVIWGGYVLVSLA